MNKIKRKKKYIFLGDCDSLNIEIICKGFSKLKKKNLYIIIGNINEFKRYLKKLKSSIIVKEIINPYDFDQCEDKYLNMFNIENISNKKYKNILNQIQIANIIANKTRRDLITMPINKSTIKKNTDFVGMTEYLGKLNKTSTLMLMLGDKLSVIPFTTHINIKNVYKSIKIDSLIHFLKKVLKLIKRKEYYLNFKEIIFICYNPHCGENGTLGDEDMIINRVVKKLSLIKGPVAADSAFKSFKKNTLFITTYHDQGLIPFKSLNKSGINLTLGLKYRRLSPIHGTASDKKFNNEADTSSYISCMLF